MYLHFVSKDSEHFCEYNIHEQSGNDDIHCLAVADLFISPAIGC